MPTVLIVDDNAGFRATARAVLEGEGWAVAEAGAGAPGVETARELRPDLVLLDVQLPDQDGFEVAGRLAELEPAPAVVLTSSRDAADYGPLIDACEARGFIPKSELSCEAIRGLVPSLDER